MKRYWKIKSFWLLFIVPFLLPILIYFKQGYDQSLPIILEIGDFSSCQIAFSPDGRWLATGGDKNGSGWIKVIETKNFKPIKSLAVANFASTESLFFSSDSSHLVLSGEEDLAVWNMSSKHPSTIIRQVNKHWVENAEEEEYGVASPDGRYYLSFGGKRDARIWDIKSRKVVKTWKVPAGLALGFTSDGRYLMLSGENAGSGETDSHVTHLLDKFDSANYSSLPHLSLVNNDTIRILSDSNSLEVWKIRPLRQIVHLPGLAIWTMRLNQRIEHVPGLNDVFKYGYTISFSPDGRFLIAGETQQKRTILESLSLNYHYEGRVRIWDARTGRYLRVLPGFNVGVKDHAWSPSGSQLSCIGMDGKIYIWNM